MAKGPLEIHAFRHKDDTRLNIPTAELEPVMEAKDKSPIEVAYERRNRDLDPQLVWRGKDLQDWSDLVVNAPPIYIQEKVHPKVMIEDLKKHSREGKPAEVPPDLFADFNGLKDKEFATEFYQHDQHWSNRMILGDSLAIMASLAERENLRGKVQCIFLDPPYGIKFNSNFQWSTTSTQVKDGAKDHFTREPEMVRAFRDIWKDEIHSYMTYLRDRLTVARDLLHESGSIFIQISEDNLHLVTSLLDEVFGSDNKVAIIPFRKKTMPFGTKFIEQMSDFIVWFAKRKDDAKGRAFAKYRPLYREMNYSPKNGFPLLRATDGTILDARLHENWFEIGKLATSKSLEPSGLMQSGLFRPMFEGKQFNHPKNGYGCDENGLKRLIKANRIIKAGNLLRYLLFSEDKSMGNLTAPWYDTVGADDKVYVVQTNTEVIKRCILMTTDPGDLVLDPTCGSGTTAYVAEQWGRRWITVDTSRVSLAIARSRLMGARYPYYVLADSFNGQKKEAEVTRTVPKTNATHGNIRHGFVYERVPHVTLKDIADNAEIDVIWEKWQEALEPLRSKLNLSLGTTWEEWEIPREFDAKWSAAVQADHQKWWDARIARQNEIDASIAAKAEFEYLYDKPYTDNARVRVAGPFTVESLSPHRVLAMSDDDELIDILEASEGKLKISDRDASLKDFGEMVLENLRAAGVQQADKNARITFTSVTGWPGQMIGGEARYREGDIERRAAILIGPEFGTVSRPDLVAAAREAGDSGFDILVACAFNYDAQSTEFDHLGKVPVLKARMNPDLMMSAELKATGAGNLFVVFGEPDIRKTETKDGQIQVQVFGVDVFKPQTGEVVSESTDGIALWMIDTDYNEESFFVRHCYFLGANDPYKALRTTLRAEIDEEAWATLNSDISRPFPKPKSGRFAVKVINHLGDEVMKVFRV